MATCEYPGCDSTCYDPDSNHNWYSDSNLKSTLNCINEEMITSYGIPCKWLPANINSANSDYLFGENRSVIFDTATDIKLLFDNYQGGNDNNGVYSDVGLEFKEELTLWISKNQVDDIIAETGYNDLGEGDLIYISFIDSLYEISYYNKEPEEIFYSNGQISAYKLTLQKYKQSVEDSFSETGIDNDDIADIVNETVFENENSDLDDELDDIKNTDDDEGGDIFNMF